VITSEKQSLEQVQTWAAEIWNSLEETE
jgi:hypothetical protein